MGWGQEFRRLLRRATGRETTEEKASRVIATYRGGHTLEAYLRRSESPELAKEVLDELARRAKQYPESSQAEYDIGVTIKNIGLFYGSADVAMHAAEKLLDIDTGNAHMRFFELCSGFEDTDGHKALGPFAIDQILARKRPNYLQNIAAVARNCGCVDRAVDILFEAGTAEAFQALPFLCEEMKPERIKAVIDHLFEIDSDAAGAAAAILAGYLPKPQQAEPLNKILRSGHKSGIAEAARLVLDNDEGRPVRQLLTALDLHDEFNRAAADSDPQAAAVAVGVFRGIAGNLALEVFQPYSLEKLMYQDRATQLGRIQALAPRAEAALGLTEGTLTALFDHVKDNITLDLQQRNEITEAEAALRRQKEGYREAVRQARAYVAKHHGEIFSRAAPALVSG